MHNHCGSTSGCTSPTIRQHSLLLRVQRRNVLVTGRRAEIEGDDRGRHAELPDSGHVTIRAVGANSIQWECVQAKCEVGDMTMWGPVHDYSQLKEGGVVFCAVQPSNKVCAAMIYKVGICDSPDGGQEGYQMVCNPMTESMAYSGWCTAQNIFGQLVYACYDRLHQPVCHTLAF